MPLIAEGRVRSTQVINQSKYAAAMSEATREEYFAGKSMYRREGRFERLFLWDPNINVPVLPGLNLNEDMIMETWMEPGDVVLFNTCLWHRLPTVGGTRARVGFASHLCPIQSHLP